MKKLLNARSPFWQLLIYSVGFYIALLLVQRHSITNREQLILNVKLSLIGVILVFALCFIYGLQIYRYNRSHPESHIKYWGLLPPELKEEDEGMRMFTARATRRVYIFYATFLPFLASLYAIFLPSPIYVMVTLAFLVICHFSIYLVTIWPVLGED